MLAAKEHVAVTIRHQSGTAEEASAQAFTGLHLLHGEVCAHGLGDRIEIFTSFQTLLRQKLNLGTAAGTISERPL